jgi:hypothetical protein
MPWGQKDMTKIDRSQSAFLLVRSLQHRARSAPFPSPGWMELSVCPTRSPHRARRLRLAFGRYCQVSSESLAPIRVQWLRHCRRICRDSNCWVCARRAPRPARRLRDTGSAQVNCQSRNQKKARPREFSSGVTPGGNSAATAAGSLQYSIARQSLE